MGEECKKKPLQNRERPLFIGGSRLVNGIAYMGLILFTW